MHIVVLLMMAVFLLIGLALIRVGIKEAWRRWRNRSSFVNVTGVIVNVDESIATSSMTNSSRTRHKKFFPIIQFHTQDGNEVTFRSEMGELRAIREVGYKVIQPECPYTIGQTMEVLYDPSGKETPCINSWSGLYGPATIMMVSGIVFMGGSVLIWVAFGERIIKGFQG